MDLAKLYQITSKAVPRTEVHIAWPLSEVDINEAKGGITNFIESSAKSVTIEEMSVHEKKYKEQIEGRMEYTECEEGSIAMVRSVLSLVVYRAAMTPEKEKKGMIQMVSRFIRKSKTY